MFSSEYLHNVGAYSIMIDKKNKVRIVLLFLILYRAIFLFLFCVRISRNKMTNYLNLSMGILSIKIYVISFEGAARLRQGTCQILFAFSMLFSICLG